MKGFFYDKNLEGIKDRNKNKFYEEKYTLPSIYYTLDDKRLAVMSDIHFHPHVDKELYKLLILYASITNPDYIIMPGDQIETNSFIDNEKERIFFENFIRSLAEICPVIMIPGNHEIHNLEVRTYFRKNSKENMKGINYFESLNRINNVYFLNNVQLNLDGINFLGFSPSIDTYLKKTKHSIHKFMEEYTDVGFNVKSDEYNILLTHNSLPLTINDTYKMVDDFKYTDLVISGHWHDGYLPKFMDRKFKDTKQGLFLYPLMSPHCGIICRGMHNFERGSLFVSQGFRTWNADILLFNLFEKICANDVEEITLTKKLKK